MTNMILWVYIGLLLIGGFMGYFKGKSRISLYSSAAFAVVLALCALKILPLSWSNWFLVLLLIVFGIRAAKTRKFMPAGLMLVLTALALVSGQLL